MAITDDFFIVLEEDVRERIFANVDAIFPDALTRPDLREGSLSWTLFGPTIKEIVRFYSNLNETLLLAFLETTRGEYLDAKGLEVGIERIEATQSQGIIRFLGEPGTVIPAGTTTTTVAEDSNDIAYQIDTDTYESDGVTLIPTDDRTIVGVTDPIPRNEVQILSISGSATSGTFVLDHEGNLTGALNYNDSAANIQTALEGLPSIGVGNVECTGGPLPLVAVEITFKEDLGSSPQTLILVDTDSVVGGTTSVALDVSGSDGRAVVTNVTSVAEGLTGSAQWRYTWVSIIGDDREDVYEPDFGETAGSVPTDVETLSAEEVELTIESAPDLSGLVEVKKVNLYRSFNDGGGFGDWKLVASADVVPNTPTVIVDSVANIDFEVIDDILEDENTTGVVDIAGTSVETGIGTNIEARTITLLDDSVVGVDKVTNPNVFSGGQDEETDDDYRARLLAEIQKPPGAGNVADYVGWASEIAGVGGVVVVPEWEEEFGPPSGPGTVKVIVSGENNDQVNAALIEEVRQYISGTIAVASPYVYLDGGSAPAAYGMSALEGVGGNIDADDYEYTFSYVNVGGGETPHGAVIDADTLDNAKILSVNVVSSGATVTISDIPTGPTGTDVKNTRMRRIYRRTLGAADDNFYLVGELPDNTTTVFVDDVNEADVGLRFAPIVNSTSLFDGQAPIGAHVSVVTITEFSIKVNATIISESGYNIFGTGGNLNLGNLIRNSLKDFFDNLPAGETVYYKDVENAIHDTAGVKDFRLVELETTSGTFITNVIPPSPTSKASFDPTGTLTEASV